MLNKKRICVAPLDWGLGHASRCIPVIRALRQRGHEVMIAAQDAQQKLLSEEFSDIEFVKLPAYNISYASHSLLLMLKFPFMIARVCRCAAQEHRALQEIIDSRGIDCVISDQRFGCWSKKAYSVYISHQLCVKMPRGFGVLEKAIHQQLRRAAESYNELWIPDFPGSDNLTGDLTRKYPLGAHHRFIGMLSRFSHQNVPADNAISRDIVIMLSGPEPQRTLLELKVLKQLSAWKGSAVVCRGMPQISSTATMGNNIEIFSHRDAGQIAALLSGAGAVFCRGGYTTIMELVALGKKAVLIPTPGQTEQGYLCSRLAKQKRFIMQKQNSFDIPAGVRMLQQLEACRPDTQSSRLLESACDELCKRIK